MALELQQETNFLFSFLWLISGLLPHFLPKQRAPRAWLCYLFLKCLSRILQLSYFKQVAPRALLCYLFPAALSESLYVTCSTHSRTCNDIHLEENTRTQRSWLAPFIFDSRSLFFVFWLQFTIALELQQESFLDFYCFSCVLLFPYNCLISFLRAFTITLELQQETVLLTH